MKYLCRLCCDFVQEVGFINVASQYILYTIYEIFVQLFIGSDNDWL